MSFEENNENIIGFIKKTIVGGIFGFIVAFIFFISSTIPEEWKTYWIIMAFSGLMGLFYIAGKLYIFSQKLNFYSKYKKIYQNIPVYLTTKKYKRTIKIKSGGDADLIYEFDLKNLTRNHIPNYPAIVRYDGSLTELTVEVNKTPIDETYLNRVYNPKSIILKMKETNFVIPFNLDGSPGLRPNKEVDIKFTNKITGAFKELWNPSGEPNQINSTAVSTRVILPIKVLKLKIELPENCKPIFSEYIRGVLTTKERGYDVKEINFGMSIEKEVDLLDEKGEKPTRNKNIIKWKIKNPKVGLRYIVSFHIIEN